MSNAIIWSVNPDKVFLDRGPLGEYFAEPAKARDPKAPSELGRTEVNDIMQQIYYGQRDFHGRPEFTPITTPAKDIAKDLVQRDREDHLNGQHSGIFLSEGDVPTKEEIAAAKNALFLASQREYDKADSQWNSGGRNRMVISDRSRRAARYLNLTPPWMTPEATLNKVCPACAETIRSAATICKHCHTDFTATATQAKPQPRMQATA